MIIHQHLLCGQGRDFCATYSEQKTEVCVSLTYLGAVAKEKFWTENWNLCSPIMYGISCVDPVDICSATYSLFGAKKWNQCFAIMSGISCCGSGQNNLFCGSGQGCCKLCHSFLYGRSNQPCKIFFCQKRKDGIPINDKKTWSTNSQRYPKPYFKVCWQFPGKQ